MEDDDDKPTLLSTKPLKPEFNHLQKIIITSEHFTCGRNIGNSIVIPFLPISRLHCTFIKSENNEWFIIDNSSFGIRINNKKIQKGHQVTISDGDVITLDPTSEFVYKFSYPNDAFQIPTKRIKIEKNSDCILNDMKIKFEESQNCELKHIEEKIQSAKHLQTTTIIMKRQLQADMDRKTEQLKCDFAQQIVNLRGEKDEVEKQKSILIVERDEQLALLRNEMENNISELMKQIQKHNETESELLKENNLLRENLERERDEFLSELSRESTSKQELLEKLEAKMREQEESRLKEKQHLEETLRNETEKLRLAQEKELKEIAEQKRVRELELEQELTNIKQMLQEKVELTEQQKRETEEQLNRKMEQLQKLSEEEKIKVEQLKNEREEIQNQLLEARQNAESSLSELRQRETELASIAVARIQQQADQSSEVITTLQDQLEKVKKDLAAMETEKNSLLSIYAESAGEGTSKQSTLTEVGELMENELQCSICSELFIEAITLNCSHTFCKYCITTWKKKKKDCPICRASITAENRSLVLDTFIEKMVQNLTEEMKVKRQDILKFRAEQVSVSKKPRSATRSSTSRPRRPPRSSSGRGITIVTRTSTAGGTTIPTVDLTMLPIPISPAERPPVLAAPLTVIRVFRPARAQPSPQQSFRPMRQPAPLSYYPEVVDLTMVPTQLSPPERHSRAMGNYELGGLPAPAPHVVAGTVDVETSPAFQDLTTAATDGVTTVDHADTGPPAAPSGNGAGRPSNNADNLDSTIL